MALIDMGANPQEMREVLQNTEQRSIPLIYKNEWPFPKARKGANNLKEHSKPAHRLRKSPRKQPETIKAAGAAAEMQVGERGVVEWGGLLVYSVLAYWLISFIAY